MTRCDRKPQTIPPETPESILRNVLQGLQGQLEMNLGKPTIRMQREHLQTWRVQLVRVLQLLDNE